MNKMSLQLSKNVKKFIRSHHFLIEIVEQEVILELAFELQGHFVIWGTMLCLEAEQCSGTKHAKRQQEMKLGNGYVKSYHLDLSEKKALKNLHYRLKNNSHIGILINNAGLIRLDSRLVKSISTLTVNHFGHFYLTYLLFQQIKKSKQARIINVSSIGHQDLKKKENFYDDLQEKKRQCYNHCQSYFLSKLANIHFSQSLDSKWENIHILNCFRSSRHNNDKNRRWRIFWRWNNNIEGLQNLWKIFL